MPNVGKVGSDLVGTSRYQMHLQKGQIVLLLHHAVFGDDVLGFGVIWLFVIDGDLVACTVLDKPTGQSCLLFWESAVADAVILFFELMLILKL